MRVSDYESRWATYWPEGKTIYDVAVCLEEENALQAAEIERLKALLLYANKAKTFRLYDERDDFLGY